MQQTEKYKLNLIEAGDPFSPNALNENTQKVENALTTHEAAVAEVTDALAGRVTSLEGKSIVLGSYVGDPEFYTPRNIKLPFTPSVILIQRGTSCYLITRESPLTTTNNGVAKIVENGLYINDPSTTLNASQTYAFAALP